MLLISGFFADETGAAAIEYALIAALIGLALIGGASALSGAINQRFTDLSTSLH